MRRELDQLLSRATGNGVLVQMSIKAIKRILDVHINLKFIFLRLSVVAVKKQFVLIILSVCLYNLLSNMQNACTVL